VPLPVLTAAVLADLRRRFGPGLSDPQPLAAGAWSRGYALAVDEREVVVRVGNYGDERLVSPDVRLDAVIEFLGNAPADVLRLLSEVKRLRTLVGQKAASTADGMGGDQP
jgi:hypothetical protein